MGGARTQAGAKRRVAMKRALRKKGIKVDPNATNKLLENKYRKHMKKAPPSYSKYKKADKSTKKKKYGYTVRDKKGYPKIEKMTVKQAKKRGAIVRDAESLDDLESYYRIYLCNMQRLGISPLPFQFFKHLWDTFKPNGELKIFLAEYDHKVIAGVLRFVYKQVVYAWGAVSLSEYWNVRPMDLLEWHTIEWGVEHNLKLFDFCATPNDPSSGLYRFKESWGGEKRILYNYHILLQPNRWKLYKFGNKLVNKVKNLISG